jgi:hypothetical protein
MTWIVHRMCRACDRIFSFPAPPIDRSVCDDCMEGELAKAHPVCQGWEESDLEHAVHLEADLLLRYDNGIDPVEYFKNPVPNKLGIQRGVCEGADIEEMER